MRQLLSIIAGLVTAVLIIIMAQMIKEGLYPTPLDLNYSNKSAVDQWFATLPSKAFWIIAISHCLAAFAAGLISALVSEGNRIIFGMISFSVIFVSVLIYLFTYNLPTWFVVTDTVATALLGFSGVVLGSKRMIR